MSKEPDPKMTTCYTISWAHHAADLSSGFRCALDNPDNLSDLAVDCRGHLFRLHKVILAATSSFFASRTSELFVRLDDVSPDVFKCLVDFMYFGRALVPEPDLEAFSDAGERMGVRGLCSKTEVKKEEEVDLSQASQPEPEVVSDGKGTRQSGEQSQNRLTLSRQMPSKRLPECNNLSCPSCQASLGSEMALNEHAKSCRPKLHVPEKEKKKLHRCEICGKSFKSEWYFLHTHLPSHKKEEKRSKKALSPKKKKRTVVSQENFVPTRLKKNGYSVCTMCDRRFFTKENLDKHIKKKCKYVGQPPQCDVCERIFHSDLSLSNHVKGYHLEAFKCKDCEQLLGSKAALLSHIVKHEENPRLYECSNCGRGGFRFLAAKANHERHCRK